MVESSVAFVEVSPHSFEQTLERARAVLAEQGFGILCEIDVAATLKKKLGVERDPYVILGACHPPSAHRALAAAPEVGVLLPCNVTVSVEAGKTVVRAMRPAGVLGALAVPELAKVGEEVGQLLQEVVARICAP